MLVGEGLSPRRHLSLLSVLKLFSALRFDPTPRAKSGHQRKEGQGQSGDGGTWSGWTPASVSAQPAPLINTRLSSSPLVLRGAARIPGPSSLARTLISLQIEACGAGYNKRQKLRFGASMRAFSP